MKNIKLTILFAIILWLQVTQLSAQRNTKPDEKTSTYLEQFRSDYIKSKLEKKSALLLPYYSDNIRLMVEFQRTVFGKANVQMYHTVFLNRFEIKSYNRSELEIIDLGTMIVEDGSFTQMILSKKTGKQHNMQGKYQNIWERSPGGELLLITEGWNYDHSVDFGDELRFDEVPVVDIALRQHVPINNAIRLELAALARLQEVAISQHDFKVWSQFYADDAILLVQRQPRCEGRRAIDLYIENHAKEMPVFEKLDIRCDRIDDLGDFVIEYASHVAVWRNGESSGVGLGKDLRVWRREKNGPLKLYRHIGMYD
jgi:ketosteroid isomerase-like protein